MSVYISLLYVITSLCSIFMFNLGLVDNQKSHPSLFATFTYCLLLTLCIIPVSKLRTKHIELVITKKTERFLTNMTYVFFTVFSIFIITSIRDVYAILISGDFAVLRTELIKDDIGSSESGNIFNIILNLFTTVSFVMILVFFISIVYFKKKVLFNIMAILSSTTGLLSDIIGISRSGFFYYTIITGICLVIFWGRLSRKVKKIVVPLFAALFVGIGVYFSSVTIDRFSKNYSIGGTKGGLISYAGMPYTNYCYFFDNKPYTGVSTRFLLPFTNYVVNGYRGGTQREAEMTNISKLDCVVFMTFLGSFIMDCNQAMPFIYVLLYIWLLNLCVRNKHGGKISLFWLFVSFFLIIIPSVGCITYFYTSPFKSLSLIVLLGVVKGHKI